MLNNYWLFSFIYVFSYFYSPLIFAEDLKFEKKILPQISYLFQKSKNPKSIDVDLEFKGSSTGETQIMYADKWGGSVFHEDFSNIKVLNRLAKIETVPEKNVRTIRHKPNEILKIKYTLTQKVPSPNQTYRVIIQDKYFHLIGQASLITPYVENEKEKYLVTMEFKGFPKTYKFANSFFVNKQKNTFEASMFEILYGLYLGGDFRVFETKINDNPLYLAIRGEWKFKDTDLFETATKIVSYQRDFFNDHDFDLFLISLIPNEQDCCSSGGTGLTQSFATFASKDVELHRQIKFLLSHELFHTWNGRRIERQEPEELVYWFSEGFTDYYSRLLLLRSNEISLKEYIDDYNQSLFEYFTSPYKNEPNERILKDFWNNYDIEKLPYRRGRILAHRWNEKIKKATKGKSSIDNVLKTLFEEAQSKGTVVSAETLDRLSKPFLKKGIKQDLKNFVDKGKTIIPGKLDLGTCARLKKVKRGKLEHGYDYKKSYEKMVVAGLKIDSPAYESGLREGDQILARNIVPPIKKSSITVLDKEGKQKTFRFFAEDKNKQYQIYFYDFDQEAFKLNKKPCLDWFL